MIKALKESALHWLDNIDKLRQGKPIETGMDACALCWEYYRVSQHCNLCPFVLFTKENCSHKKMLYLVEKSKCEQTRINNARELFCLILAMYMHEVTK